MIDWNLINQNLKSKKLMEESQMSKNEKVENQVEENAAAAVTKFKVKGKKAVEKPKFNEVFKFQRKGDTVSGKVIGLRENETQYGTATYLDFIELETGEQMSIIITSNLKGYDWHGFIDKFVEIAFTDYEYNPKTRNTYKVFEVSELEVE